MFLTVDSKKCKQDGICAMACPMGLIVHTKGKVPEAIQDAEKMCVGCGHCVAICPFEALSVGGVSPKDLLTVKKELVVNKDAMEHLIRKHRSIREYQNKPVPHEIIADILDAVRWAPSAANLQPVNWLVVEKPDEVHRLAGLIAEGVRKSNFNKALTEAWDKGQDVFLRSAPHIIVAHAGGNNFMPTTDCTIALSYFDLLAYAYGIGTCWAGVLMLVASKYPPLLEALKLPEGHQVYGAMMFGYPKYQYHRIPKRKPAQITWR